MTAVFGNYLVNGVASTHIVGADTYYFSGIPSGHPMKIWQDDSAAGCTVSLVSCTNVVGEYCYGDAAWSISAGCDGHSLSLRCSNHGAMGGTDRLQFNSACSA